MKVITEESFKRAEALTPPDALIRVLRDSFQEIDTLTVSKLRPMSDAPKDGSIFLAMHVLEEIFEETYFIHGAFETRLCTGLKEDQFKGWIPMPIYKP